MTESSVKIKAGAATGERSQTLKLGDVSCAVGMLKGIGGSFIMFGGESLTATNPLDSVDPMRDK